MKEFRLILRVKNNLLQERREAEGLNIREMAERIGISYPLYSAFETMRASPYTASGELRSAACKVAEYFGVVPEDLWPADILRVKVAVAERKLDAAQIRAMLPASAEPPLLPDEYVERNELTERLHRTMQKYLSPREEKILRMRTGLGIEDEQDSTLAEIAEELEISPERVRGIQNNALARLRRHFDDDDDDDDDD